MEEKKKRKIEEQLRQLFMLENQPQEESRPIPTRRPAGIRVIRRRKGMPDVQIA